MCLLHGGRLIWHAQVLLLQPLDVGGQQPLLHPAGICMQRRPLGGRRGPRHADNSTASNEARQACTGGAAAWARLALHRMAASHQQMPRSGGTRRPAATKRSLSRLTTPLTGWLGWVARKSAAACGEGRSVAWQSPVASGASSSSSPAVAPGSSAGGTRPQTCVVGGGGAAPSAHQLHPPAGVADSL